MDVSFELLLPHVVTVPGLEYKTATYTWGGATYPQGPGSYHWGEFVELVETPIAPHIFNYLPKQHAIDNWTCLSVRGAGLDLLRAEVNETYVDWKGKPLDQLLQLLLSQFDKWAVVFELHSDQIDTVYSHTVAQCIDQLRRNLREDVNPEGFISIAPVGTC